MMKLRTAVALPALFALFFAASTTAFAEEGKAKHGLFSFGNEATVSIGGDGKTLVRGAEVTAVEDGNITAETSWNDVELIWTILTDNDTSYVGAKGESSARADIEEGDTISFTGVLEGSLKVAADIVRNWSDEDSDRTHVSGEVTEVNNGSFVVKTGNRSVTIDVDSETDFTIGKEVGELADLTTGMKVRVTGAYNGDEFEADSVTAVALKARDDDKHWRPWFDFWANLKANWNK